MVGKIKKGDTIQHQEHGQGVVIHTNNVGWVTARFYKLDRQINIRAYPPHDLEILTVNDEIFVSEYEPALGHPWRVPPPSVKGPDASTPNSRENYSKVLHSHDMPLKSYQAPRDIPIPERKRLIQNRISTLRHSLSKAIEIDNQVEMTKLRQQLVEQRIEFCKLIRTWTDDELKILHAKYIDQVGGDNGSATKYRSWCWVCKSPIAEGTNDKCYDPICSRWNRKNWYICACGACLCPDWRDEIDQTFVREYECAGQRERLGAEIYEKLLRERLGTRLYAQLGEIRARLPF